MTGIYCAINLEKKTEQIDETAKSIQLGVTYLNRFISKHDDARITLMTDFAQQAYIYEEYQQHLKERSKILSWLTILNFIMPFIAFLSVLIPIIKTRLNKKQQYLDLNKPCK